MKEKHADKIVVGGAWPSFNDSGAAWGLNRHMDSRCGQTLDDTLGFYQRYYAAANPIPFVLIETWNDYEEGTAIERTTSASCPNAPITSLTQNLGSAVAEVTASETTRFLLITSKLRPQRSTETAWN